MKRVIVIRCIREYIRQIEEIGELKRVSDKVSWKYEIAERTRRSQVTGNGTPALLFENIADYPGWRLLTNGLASRGKISAALGLDPSTPFAGCVAAFRQRLSRPLAPVMEHRGSFEENSFTGNGVDLTTLPVPWWHERDGGRYIGTWHVNISGDPETGIPNLGIYRMQLLGPRRTGLSISPGSHLARHLAAARKQGRALEMAVAIGVDETVIMAAAASFPYGTDEYFSAGGLAQEPVGLAPCRTVALDAPANAEIVLEGTIDPSRTVREGPFLDYAGIPKADPHGFVFEVSALSYRNHPIFRGAAIGTPGGEDHLLFSLLSSAGCLDFHGSRMRQRLQNALLRNHSYRLFQAVGRLRTVLGCAK